MAKSTEKPKQNNLKIFWDSIKAWEFNKTHSLILGILLIVFSIALLISFTSFFLHGNEDQSSISYFFTREDKAQNWLGKTGAWLADIFIYKGFGFGSVLFVRLFFLTGLYFLFDIQKAKLKNIWFWDLYLVVNISIALGFFADFYKELGGIVGYEMNLLLQDYLGKTGTLMALSLSIF